MNAADLLKGIKVVPVVVIEDPELAVPLAETLLNSGLPAIEVTLRTPRALEAIKAIIEQVPDMIVGAGSVRNAEQVVAVSEAGVKFAVCPGFSPALLDAVAEASLPFVPGAITPSESLQLLERGYTLQKFFPAEVAGGIAYLKSLGAPLPEVKVMPTGGVKPDNLASYLALDNVACVGGTWVAPSALLNDRDFAQIGRIAKDAAAFSEAKQS